MNYFLKNAPEIIKAAAASTLGILALMVLVLAVLAFVFFKTSPVKVRIWIFVLLFVGVVGFASSVVNKTNVIKAQHENISPATSPSRSDKPPLPNLVRSTDLPPFPLTAADTHAFSGSKHVKYNLVLNDVGKLTGEMTLENDTLFSGFSANLVVMLLDSKSNELERIQLQSGSIDGKPPGKAIHKSVELSGQVADKANLLKVSDLKVSVFGG